MEESMKTAILYARLILLWFLVTILTCTLLNAQPFYSLPDKHLPRPMVVNPALLWTESVDVPEHQGMPYQLSFDRFSDGPPTYIWSSYHNGGELLYTTGYENGKRSRSRLLSAGKGVYYQPVFILTGEKSGWAIWQRKRESHWEIAGRRLHEGNWEPVIQISMADQQALFPAACAFGSGIAVTWENHSINSQLIELRVWDGSQWGTVEKISQPDKSSYRPALTATPTGELWIVWDCYGGLNYAVYGRRIRPATGKIEQISISNSGERSNLKPTILFGKNTGLMCAWISVLDVIGGKGVLGKWNTIRVAVRRDGEWQLISAGGEYAIADLRHSMLNSIEPPGPVWGYSGRRRYPMLVESEGDAWLLWERKIEHEGSAGVAGELCGRKFDGRDWSEKVQLHSGMVNYYIPTTRKTFGARLNITALNTQHQYYSFNISLENPAKLAETELTGWKSILLPLRDFDNRKSISLDGETYHLYWGDIHFHTVLTPDAEGEVDEMMHFARDKAKIDVVVMQENDAASWLNSSAQGVYQGENLAESAYQLSVYYSRKYTEPGRFIALPGWEWSDRTDDGRPNHRTVIFAGDDTPILRHTENRGNFTELCDVVDAAGGVMNTQHQDFQLVDRPVDANIEVVAGWGNYLDPPDKIHAVLSKGFKVGFVGTSDGHSQNIGIGGGLTGIYATGLTVEAILEAIKSHRVFATNGNRMFIDARANGVFMGQDTRSNGAVEFRLRVDAPRPLVMATLIRDGKTIHSISGKGRTTLDARYTDTPEKGFHWYYWQIRQEGEWPDYPGNMKVAEGHLGWSSPHRVMIE